jgi:hypothetical protein
MADNELIPMPIELAQAREQSKTVEGVIKRVARIITERPDLDTYSFKIGPLEVAEQVVKAFRAAGWKARFVSKNDVGESPIEIYWPDAE